MSAYKFRILLDSSKEDEIFRDIVIAKNDSFERFYRTILASFNFSSEEMASFYMSNDEWDKGHEITLMDMSFGDEDNDTAIMSATILQDEVLVAGQKIILVHDFLKMWIFLIELQQEIEEKIEEPYVALSIGIAPDENSKRDDIVMESDFVEMDDEDEDYFEGFESLDDEDFSDGFESYDEFNY